MLHVNDSKELLYHIKNLGKRVKVDNYNIDEIMILTGVIVNDVNYKFIKNNGFYSGVCFYSNLEQKYIIEV